MNVLTEIYKNLAVALLWQYAIIFLTQACLFRFVSRTRQKLRYWFIVAFVAIIILCPLVNVAMLTLQYIESSKVVATDELDQMTGKQWLVIADQADATSQQEYSLYANIIETLEYLAFSGGLLFTIAMTIFYQLRRYGLRNTSRELSGEFKNVFADLVEIMGISRSMRIYKSFSVNEITMTGFYRPSVILPESADCSQEKIINTLIVWQLARIKIHDNLLRYMCSIINCIFFYNPAIWFITRNLKKQLRATCFYTVQNATNINLIETIGKDWIKPTARISVAIGIKILLNNMFKRITVTVRSLPRLGFSVVKSPANIISILLLVGLLVVSSGLLHNSGGRIMFMLVRHQDYHLEIKKRLLYKAIEDANLAVVRDVISKNPEMITITNDEGSTLLHLAAKNPDGLHIVDYLIAMGIDIDAVDNYYRSAIHYYGASDDTISLLELNGLWFDVFAAAGHGKIEKLNEMLEEQPDLIHAVDRSQRTLLNHAAQTDQVEIAKMLFDKGLKPDIYWASRLEYEYWVNEIIADEGYMFTADTLLPFGGPLDVAVKFSYDKIVKLLLKAGASPEGDLDQEERPLRQVVWNGDSSVAELLLEHGARPVLDLYIVDGLTNQIIACNGSQVLVSGFDFFDKQEVLDGRLLLDLPNEGVVAVKSQLDGYVPVRVSWLIERYVPQVYQLALTKGVFIGGEIRDYIGASVGGAKLNLEIMPNYMRHNIPSVDVSINVTSDQEGNWIAHDMPRELEGLCVYVQHPDYFADTPCDIASMPTTQAFRDMEAVFVLPNKVCVSGHVFDKVGNAVSDADIRLISRNDIEFCRSDYQGKYELVNVSAAKTYYKIDAAGFSSHLEMIDPTENIDDYDIVLQDSRTIKLKVVDGSDNSTIPNAAFDILYWKGCSLRLNFKTDKNGEAVWENAPVDEIWLSYAAREYQINKIFVSDNTDEYVLKLYKPVHISGRVTNSTTGGVIRNFLIYAEHESVDLASNETVNTSYEPQYIKSVDGVYTIEQVVSEQSHTLRIEAEGYEPQRSDVFYDEDGNVEIDFQLKPMPWISGAVIQSDGIEAIGAEVVLIESDTIISLINSSIIDDEREIKMLVVESHGRYKFYPKQTGWLLVAYNDYGFSRMSEADYANANTIVLQPWSKLTGCILLDGEPLINQNLIINSRTKLVGEMMLCHRVRTDAQGNFEVTRIAAGQYWIGLPGETAQAFTSEITEFDISLAETVNLKIECVTE